MRYWHNEYGDQTRSEEEVIEEYNTLSDRKLYFARPFLILIFKRPNELRLHKAQNSPSKLR
jgi:hypothetical protein